MPPEKNHRRGGNCHRLNERPPRKGFGWASGFDLCLHQPISATPGRARSSFGGLSEPLVQPLWHLWRQHKPILISGNFIVCFPPPKEHITIILAHPAMFFGNLSARKESTKGWWLMWTLICLGMPLLHCFFLLAFCMWNYMSAVFCHLDRSTSILRAICSSGVEIPTAIDYNWWFWACERFLNSDCSVISPSEDVHCWEQCPVLRINFYGLPVPSRGERNGAPYIIQLVSKEVHSSRWNQ